MFEIYFIEYFIGVVTVWQGKTRGYPNKLVAWVGDPGFFYTCKPAASQFIR
jgi:hypothetical protein